MRCRRGPGMDDGRGARANCLPGGVAAAAVDAWNQGSGRPGSGRPGSHAPTPCPILNRTRGRIWRRSPSCQGAITAEFAVALPAVLLLFALLLAGSVAGVTQLRLEEAARAGARALARGEDMATVGGIVRRLAGESATSAVDSDGGWLAVTVSARVGGVAGSLVPWTLTARVWARTESAGPQAVVVPSLVPQRRSRGAAA